MPSFDLRGIKCAKYVNNQGTISYETPMKVGDAMNVNLELRFAEGRLYAESSLAEYMKLATGGTISIAVKYLPNEVQKLLFGAKENTRALSGEKNIKSLKMTAKDAASYVGVAFYAPDQIDGVTKYTTVFVSRALFGPPSYVYQTRGENITFNTPTTSGEFLASQASTQELLEVGVCDSEEDAIAWVDAVLGGE